MFNFGAPGDRQITIMSAGNLATTQSVIARVRKDIDDHLPVNLFTVATLRDAAEYLGQLSVAEQEKRHADNPVYDASFIIGGQIGPTGKHGIFLIYPEGNYIKSSKDTPFLQIGESKYGRPILDRIIRADTPLNTAALSALVSMDSTIKSNLTVGPPIEVTIYQASPEVQTSYHQKFEEDSAYLRDLKVAWDKSLRESFSKLPPISWSVPWDQQPANEQNENF
jgi:putative proteasome-type protease